MSEMMNKSTQKMTIEDFDKISEDNSMTYELIDGVVCMSPRPTGMHQKTMSNLVIKIGNYLASKPCDILTEVELEIDENIIVPDITIFCNINTVDKPRFNDIPSLVIEILSPSNTVMEMDYKKDKYKNHGINEFWVVNPKNCSIIKHNLKNNTSITYIKSGSIISNVFPDLEIKLSDIFLQK